MLAFLVSTTGMSSLDTWIIRYASRVLYDVIFFSLRAWVPLNNCYLMSKEIPFSVKKTKSIFNSAMQEMEVYVENMRKKFGVFNYAPFRTPYTPDNNFQMLLDPANPSSTPVKSEKQEKIKLSFDMTASPKIALSRTLLPGVGVGGSTTSRRLPLSEMPRSPMSTNSSAHTGSDGEQESAEKSQSKAPNSQFSTGEDSMDCTGNSVGAFQDSNWYIKCKVVKDLFQAKCP